MGSQLEKKEVPVTSGLISLTLGTRGKGLGGEDRLAGELRLRAAAPGRRERLHCAQHSGFSPGFFPNDEFHGTLVPWQGFWEAAGSKALSESPRGRHSVRGSDQSYGKETIFPTLFDHGACACVCVCVCVCVFSCNTVTKQNMLSWELQ